MNHILEGIIKYRKTIVISFLILAVFSMILLPGTSVNYKMIDYLPKDANSTRAVRTLQESFEQGMPNLSVMIENMTIPEALDMKASLKALEGVSNVLWLDDVLGLETLKATPLSFLDTEITQAYYKNDAALFSVVIRGGQESRTIQEIYALIGESGAVTGEALMSAGAQESSTTEVVNAMYILIPILIFMLVVATDSWLEPVLFMLTIGVAIVINMGSNIVFGQVSFITQTVSPVLQLAVSMDYAIFLLHSFSEHRKTLEPKEAMLLAMKTSIPTVAASAATTMVGFAALIFMKFGIGADLGLNLLKGIAISFITVMVFLPVVTLVCHRWLEKTMHRDLLPYPGKLSEVLLKVRIPLLLVAILFVVPAFLGQSEVEFLYGLELNAEGSRTFKDRTRIEGIFDADQPLLLLVPRSSMVKEEALVKSLTTLPRITQVIAYVNTVGLLVPEDYIPDAAVQQFYSDHYARIILYTDVHSEGDQAFNLVEAVRQATLVHYDEYYLGGQTPSLKDMKDVVAIDLASINWIAIAGIFVVLLLTFKSLSLPLILIFTIESAIWINLSIPYFTGTAISFIGYLILSTVQLGATVDYAILMTHRYLAARRETGKRAAMYKAMKNNIAAVLISATILSTAGFSLALATEMQIIKELGILLGRGTILSFVMIVAVLPALLVLLDKVIQKTTWRHGFHTGREEES